MIVSGVAAAPRHERIVAALGVASGSDDLLGRAPDGGENRDDHRNCEPHDLGCLEVAVEGDDPGRESGFDPQRDHQNEQREAAKQQPLCLVDSVVGFTGELELTVRELLPLLGGEVGGVIALSGNVRNFVCDFLQKRSHRVVELVHCSLVGCLVRCFDRGLAPHAGLDGLAKLLERRGLDGAVEKRHELLRQTAVAIRDVVLRTNLDQTLRTTRRWIGRVVGDVRVDGDRCGRRVRRRGGHIGLCVSSPGPPGEKAKALSLFLCCRRHVSVSFCHQSVLRERVSVVNANSNEKLPTERFLSQFRRVNIALLYYQGAIQSLSVTIALFSLKVKRIFDRFFKIFHKFPC